MKVNNYISMFFLAGAALLASCSQDEEAALDNQDALKGFQISVTDEGFTHADGATRAVESGYATRFTNGDEIGIFAVRGDAVVSDINNRKFTLQDGVWELTDDGDPIEYKGSQFQKMQFYAYYPYNKNVQFDATSAKPFEAYVAKWTVGANQGEGDYTKYDLMTSVGTVKGDRLKGQIAFDMKHEMALAVVKMPKLTYHFTNVEVADYQLPLKAGSFTLNNAAATAYYQESTDTYRFLVNPNKEFTIKGTYTGVGEMEYEAKGTLESGTAKLYTIKDESKIEHALQVGDYFCADGKLVSKDAETAPENAIGIVCHVGNPQPSVTHPAKYTEINDALRSDYPACVHGMVLSLKNSVVEDYATHMFHSGKKGYYFDWLSLDDTWKDKLVTANTEAPATDFPAFLGYNNTKVLTMCYEGMGQPNTCDWAYKHIMAYRSEVAIPASVSPWYLPSIMGWDAVVSTLGDVNKSLLKVGGDEMVSVDANAKSGHYWSTTTRNETYMWTHGLDGGQYIQLCERGSTAGYFRMMLAF